MKIKILIYFLFSFSIIYSQGVEDYQVYCDSNNSINKIKQSQDLNSYATVNHLKFSFPLIAGSLALTGILLASDDQTYEILKSTRDNSPFLSKISPAITQLGNGKFPLLLFSGMGVFHFLTNDKKSGDAAILGLESFLLSGIAVQLLKHTFGRERPSNRTIDGGKWNGPFIYHKNISIASFDAFPSGHTATIFAAASTLSYIYPNGIVPYISYSVASLVALSRVTESTHWLSDCLIGGLIGYFSTQLLYNLQNKNTNINFGITNQHNSYAFTISYNLP